MRGKMGRRKKLERLLFSTRLFSPRVPCALNFFLSHAWTSQWSRHQQKVRKELTFAEERGRFIKIIFRFQLTESGIQNKLVAELFLPIPEPSHMSGRVELESFEFSSDHQVFYKHEGVGSGKCTPSCTNQAWCHLYSKRV